MMCGHIADQLFGCMLCLFGTRSISITIIMQNKHRNDVTHKGVTRVNINLSLSMTTPPGEDL